MEEELQSALKTFLAEGDKVSRVDWGLHGPVIPVWIFCVGK